MCPWPCLYVCVHECVCGDVRVRARVRIRVRNSVRGSGCGNVWSVAVFFAVTASFFVAATGPESAAGFLPCRCIRIRDRVFVTADVFVIVIINHYNNYNISALNIMHPTKC